MKIWIERKIKSKLALASFNSHREMEARIQEECSQTKQIFHGLGTTHYQGRQFSVELQKRIVSTYLIWLKMKVAQLCPTLCNHMDYTVHGILQARILEWVTGPFSRGSSQPRNRTQVSSIAGRFFTSLATREAQYALNMVQKRGRWGKNGIDNVFEVPPSPTILQRKSNKWIKSRHTRHSASQYYIQTAEPRPDTCKLTIGLI